MAWRSGHIYIHLTTPFVCAFCEQSEHKAYIPSDIYVIKSCYVQFAKFKMFLLNMRNMDVMLNGPKNEVKIEFKNLNNN